MKELLAAPQLKRYATMPDDPSDNRTSTSAQALSFPRYFYRTTVENLRHAAGIPIQAAVATDVLFIAGAAVLFIGELGPPWFAALLLLIGVVGLVEKTYRRVR